MTSGTLQGMWTNPLAVTAHRPWPIPSSAYRMRMTWSQLLFAHWPIAVEAIAPLVPGSLELDTFDSAAWIGVVPFQMSNVALRVTPAAPWFSSFLELNVRTYVVRNGKPGVFFLSLDAANPAAVAVARRWFHLPYFNAQMTLRRDGDWHAYTSQRKHRGMEAGIFDGRYRPAGDLALGAPGSLEAWLTERYCLYAVDRAGRAYRGDIHHRQWPLQPAEAEISANTVADAFGIALPATPPLLHFADRLDVVAWNPVRLD